MPTLAELCKEYGIDPDLEEGQEKTASVQNEEVSKINEELNGGNDMGLQNLYNDVFEGEELEKIAEMEAQGYTSEEEAMEKVASDYVAAGRFMARGFYDELEKIAEAKEVFQMSDSEKLPTQLHAEGANGTQIDDDSQLSVNTLEARKANADALKEKKVNKIMGKKESVNVSGQVGEDHMVAPDANK